MLQLLWSFLKHGSVHNCKWELLLFYLSIDIASLKRSTRVVARWLALLFHAPHIPRVFVYYSLCKQFRCTYLKQDHLNKILNNILWIKIIHLWCSSVTAGQASSPESSCVFVSKFFSQLVIPNDKRGEFVSVILCWRCG